MVELSQDLVLKEQQIEVLISSLPGLDNSEMDQQRSIKELEEDLKAAEAQRQEAIKEKDQTLAELDAVIRSIRRPWKARGVLRIIFTYIARSMIFYNGLVGGIL